LELIHQYLEEEHRRVRSPSFPETYALENWAETGAWEPGVETDDEEPATHSLENWAETDDEEPEIHSLESLEPARHSWESLEPVKYWESLGVRRSWESSEPVMHFCESMELATHFWVTPFPPVDNACHLHRCRLLSLLVVLCAFHWHLSLEHNRQTRCLPSRRDWLL
jgi:hypothetical protein